MNRLPVMLLISVFLTACQTDRDRAISAGARIGAAAAQSQTDPPLPEDCRKRERSGVVLGDPLDVALIKTDQALGRANSRVARCANWHDTYRNSLGGDVE
ncbi:hypothetical protein GFK88_17060 [Roseibium aggregatum]|nr:hypothetical protein GFK88_17060 [Roseibium aggregatum]